MKYEIEISIFLFLYAKICDVFRKDRKSSGSNEKSGMNKRDFSVREFQPSCTEAREFCIYILSWNNVGQLEYSQVLNLLPRHSRLET